MLQSAAQDMTKGNEASQIVRFALPLLAGNLLQQLYNVADTAIVGKQLGDDALAAVGATGWDCNEFDGSVSMELQGTPAQIDRVLASLEESRMVSVASSKLSVTGTVI